MSPFLLLLLQDPTTPAPQVAPALDLRQAPAIVEAQRIRLTPRLDGRLEDEEWDALGTSGEVRTYLQWEPGALHVAAAGAAGHDLLISIDPDGDGWLVGKNNLEARVGTREGKPFVKLRMLDATNVSGPVYKEIVGLESASGVAVGADGTIEASIVDPGLMLLPKKAGRFAVRVDVVRADEASLPANEPRALVPLELRDFRSAALPSGLKTKADFTDVPIVPGEELRIRFGFSGDPMPKRIAVRSEGLAREVTSASEMPFPTNGKKDATVEYKTQILPDAMPGYRIARATLMGSDGVPALLQASYRIAPLADIELKETRIKPSDKDRSPRLGYIVTGNSRRRLAGRTTISVPAPFRILNGDDEQKLILAEPRQGLPKGFGLFVPANASGTIPITFSMEIDRKKFEIVRYFTID